MEISFSSHLNCSKVIAIKFCTWHDSCAVVASEKFCRNMTPYNGVTLKPIFHRICIMMENHSWNGPLMLFSFQWFVVRGQFTGTKICGVSLLPNSVDILILYNFVMILSNVWCWMLCGGLSSWPLWQGCDHCGDHWPLIMFSLTDHWVTEWQGSAVFLERRTTWNGWGHRLLNSPCLGTVYIKIVFPGLGIPIMKIRRSGDRLIFIIGIPIPGKTVL